MLFFYSLINIWILGRFIVLNTIYLSTNKICSSLNLKAELSLTSQQKRIAAIICFAFACLATAYAIFACNKQRQVALQQKVQDNKIKKSEAAFEQAMELMFDNRKLNWGEWLDPASRTAEQKVKRHEELKGALAELLPQQVNSSLIYRDSIGNREQTLLLQAIMEIRDPAHRLEIVKILLAKGADIDGQGYYYGPINVMDEANQTKDQQLIEFLQLANTKKKARHVLKFLHSIGKI